MDTNLNGVKVPIIEPHRDQKLIVSFVRNDEGNDCIQFDFDPPIPEVRTPAQAAAVNVANHIIREYALDKKQTEATNGEKTGD